MLQKHYHRIRNWHQKEYIIVSNWQKKGSISLKEREMFIAPLARINKLCDNLSGTNPTSLNSKHRIPSHITVLFINLESCNPHKLEKYQWVVLLTKRKKHCLIANNTYAEIILGFTRRWNYITFLYTVFTVLFFWMHFLNV